METPKVLQNKLFHDSVEDALTTDVLACGGYKKVGHLLRADLTPEQAAAWLRACLNVERQEKLGPGHVIEIKRMALENESTAAIDYESQQLGYEPKWVAPEDQVAVLASDISDDFKRIEARQHRLEKLLERMFESGRPMRAVK